MKLQKYSFGPMFPSSVFWIFKQKSVYKGLLLDLVEMVIFAFQGHQLFVVAALHNASVLDEQYRVSIADGAQTVCNDNGGMFFYVGHQRFLEEVLRFVVQSGCGLVQNEHLRVAQQGAGNAEPLALATGKPHPTVTDDSLIALLHFRYELMGLGNLRCRIDLLFRDIGQTEDDVVVHRVVKQYDILADHAEEVAQIGNPVLLVRHAVYQNLPEFDIVKTRQKIHHRGFAASRRADNGHHLPFAQGEIYMVQHIASLFFLDIIIGK